jgi:phosphatidylinositol 3-kinase
VRAQIIRVMDRLLRRENLDLRLTPYWVLPMSAASGILEFVPSRTLQDLTARSKAEGILRFLMESNPARPHTHAGDVPAGQLRASIAPAAMENFIRSNAGYAIISYLLDMGDRHQENLLLTKDGKLFHIGALL